MINDTLWSAYSAVLFEFEAEIPVKNFSVITAWNPKSQRLPEQENCVNNKRLLKMISEYEWVSVRVGDAQFEWIEESFAVVLDIERSLNVARQFSQNAIYYVRQGQLMLYSCTDARVTHLGALSEKIYKKLE